MGQVLVIGIRTEMTEDALEALKRAGFAVQDISQQNESQHGFKFRCARNRSAFQFSVYKDGERPGTTLVVFPYPPYTFLPWRWPSDHRLFDDVTAVFDEYEIKFQP